MAEANNVILTRILRAALYERVSSEEQALRGFSIETQIDNLTEFCQKNSYKIVDHYTDEGISGAKPPLKRPALNRLLDDVQGGKIDIIFFTKLDRWFRSVPEYFKVQEILDAHHVEWKAIHEDYDTTTANGRMAITLFMAIAQNEREKAGERVKAVYAYKFKNKEACFSGKPPFGYMKQNDKNGIPRLVKNPEEQQATEAFWDIMIKTGNLSQAAKCMHDVYGVQKVFSAWSNMLKNKLYYGYHGDIKDFCEPYVTREQWQAVLAARPTKKAKDNHVYLFTGMIRCPECGKTLTMTPVIRSNGTRSYYYRCRIKTTNACSWKYHISETKTEEYLLQHIEDLINTEIETLTEEKQKIKQTSKSNLAVLNEQLKHLTAMYIAGNKSDDEFLQESSHLKGLIEKAQSDAHSSERNPEHLKAFLATDYRRIYKTLSPEERRKLWRSIIKEIEVEKNNVKRIIFTTEEEEQYESTKSGSI